MNPATARWALLVPLLAYASGVALVAGPSVPPVGLVAAIAVALPLVEVGTDRLGPWAYLPLGGLAVVGLAGGAGMVDVPALHPVAVGGLLGAPAGLLGALYRLRGSAVALVGPVAAAELALVETSVARGAAGPSVASWIGSASSVLSDQARSLGAFAHGGPIPPSPIATLSDPWLIGLALLPLAGFLAAGLLPAGRGSGAGPSPAHLYSLSAAIAAVLGLEVVAALEPPQVVVAGLAIAATEVLVALTVASRWPRAPGRPASATATPVSGRPASPTGR
jgi:hypothetical protein